MYWVGRSIAAIIFNLRTRWAWIFNFRPRPLYTRMKRPPFLLNSRPVGSQSRSGRLGEEKNSCSCLESNNDSSVLHLVSWLLHILRCPDFLGIQERTTMWNNVMINVTDGRRIRRKTTRRKVCEGVVFVCMRWLRRNELEMGRWMELVMPIRRPKRWTRITLEMQLMKIVPACSVKGRVS